MGENTIYQPASISSAVELGVGNTIHEYSCIGKYAQISSDHKVGGTVVLAWG